LNSCNFYGEGLFGFDDGDYVASLCHLKIEGSWVEYDEYNEVKCPAGPVRTNVWTNESFDIYSDDCSNLVKIPLTTLYNGESIVANLIFCADSEDRSFFDLFDW